MPGTVNQEWLNQNSLRAYPLKENVSRVASGLTGVVLPNYIIVDFIMTVPGTQDTRLYLSQIAYVGNILTFVFADQSDVQVATCSVDTNTHVQNDGYQIIGNSSYSDALGRMVVGDISRLNQDLAEGLYTFTLATAELEPSTVRPAIRSVRSVRTLNQDSESDYIYGHLKLLAGTNIQLTYLPDYNAIRIDAIDGSNMNETCECADTTGTNNIVKLVNGIPIEDVEITGDGVCVDVNVSGNSIVISDICSAPCCGCPELELITESLKILEKTVGNLEKFAQQLNTRISTFVSNYILTITG